MAPITKSGLRTVYKAILRAERVRKEGVKTLDDLFTEEPRLIISPNNECVGSCLHCVADSTPSGVTMNYYDFKGITPDFFKIFSVVDFGRKGNPLTYNSDDHDLVDLMTLLNEQGIDKFTLALALQTHQIPVLKRLEEFVKETGSDIETMITYHHYYRDLDKNKLAKDFNSTLKNFLGFSKKIIISLLGDQYSQKEQTKAEEVHKTFQNSWDKIFADTEIINTNSMSGTGDRQKYRASYKSNEAEIVIPPLSTRVYPLGRFRRYLDELGVLQQYEEKFEKSLSDYVCPDLIKWPGIIIEPDGGLNLCASFEAINCSGAVVTNIFTKPYSQVKEELIQFHKRELDWFIKHLSDITDGKISTCKLKNNCYQQHTV